MASFRTAVDCNTNVANSIKIQNLDARITEAVELLKQLIATPSRSRDEARTADLLTGHLAAHGIAAERLYNNVYARAAHFDAAKPTLLLNSHHDTVRPAASRSFAMIVVVVVLPSDPVTAIISQGQT